MIIHQGAFISEIIQVLKDKKNKEIIVDGTTGTGSHSIAILEKFAQDIKSMICIDIDSEILEIARTRINEFIQTLSIKPDIYFVNDNYRNTEKILLSNPCSWISSVQSNRLNRKADVIVLDLGVSTYHLKTPERGFGFDSDIEDMRYNRKSGQSAIEIIKNSTTQQLNDILTAYAGIKKPQKLSEILKKYIYEENSKLKTQSSKPHPKIHNSKFENQNISLACYLQQRLPKIRGKLHPATLIFQALRIAVNNELENVESFLKTVPKVLNTDGLLFIITYHSIEDRIVKICFKNLVKTGQFVHYNKKVIKPTYQEIRENRSIRSAKLRILYRK